MHGLGGTRVDLAAAEGREAGAGGKDGGDEVGAGAEPAARAREEREREARARPREGGDEDRVGAEVGGGQVRAEGAERVGEAARGGVEGDELREEDRVRAGARGDDEVSVELRGVSGNWVARAAQRREEGRQLADAAGCRCSRSCDGGDRRDRGEVV